MSPCSGSNISHMTGLSPRKPTELSQCRGKGRTNECGWGIDRIWGYERNGDHASRNRFRDDHGAATLGRESSSTKSEISVAFGVCIRAFCGTPERHENFCHKVSAIDGDHCPVQTIPFSCISRATKKSLVSHGAGVRKKRHSPHECTVTHSLRQTGIYLRSECRNRIPYHVSISLAPRN